MFYKWIFKKWNILAPQNVKHRTNIDPALRTQSCLTLCDPMDYSPLGSSMHGISQARMLEWVAICSSRGSSQPRIEPASPKSPALQADSLPLHHLGSPRKHPSIPILGIYSKELKTDIQVNTCTHIFITQRWKQLKCALADEWINQMKYNHTMEYYSVKKKKWSTYACNSVDKAELSKYYTKWKKPDTKPTYSAIPFIWNIQGR